MPTINAIVDLSHHNGTPDFGAAKGDGILAVIHKATQGDQYTDPEYQGRRQAALDAGLLWGAYHFGVGGDGVAQAEKFVSVVKPQQTDLLVLDLEHNPAGPTMTVDQAEAFVRRVHDLTGGWPGLYSGSYVKESLPANYAGVLANCWFWLAQYGPTPQVPPAWSQWTLWQYTDGSSGQPPYTVRGIGACDRDFFNGDASGLKTLWKVPA